MVVLYANANAQGTGIEITSKMTSPMMGGNPMPMVVDIKGDKAVTTMNNPMGEMKVYTDNSTHKTVLVMGGKTGYEVDAKKAEELAAAKKDSIVPVATGQKKTINGYNCELYTATSSDADFEMWMTSDFPKDITEAMKKFSSGGGIGGMRGGKANPFGSLMEKGLAPVQTDVKNKGQLMASIEFVKYERKSLDDAMFIVPSDVTIQPMPAMMGGQGK